MTPRVLDMLLMSSLAMKAGIENPGYTHSSPEEWRDVVDYAHAEGLWGGGGLTPRAHVWLGMIEAVPLPVQQWADPRGGRIATEEIAKSIYDGATQYVPPDPAPRPEPPAPTFTPSPEQKAAAYAATVPKPPEGFAHHLGQPWYSLDPDGVQKPNWLPQGLAPDDQVEVWYRDGLPEKRYPDKSFTDKDGKTKSMRGSMRPAGFRAASVNWQHRGGDDDIVGWRKLDQPEVTKMVMPKR